MSIFSKLFSSRKKEDSIPEMPVQEESMKVNVSRAVPEAFSQEAVPKDIPSALLSIINSRGTEVLSQPLLLNILSDYHLFADQRALKNGLRQIQQGGYIPLIINSANWELDCATISLKIINELGIQERIVSYLVASMGYGLGRMKDIPVLQESIEQSNNQTNINSQDNESQTSANYVPTSELSKYVLPKYGMISDNDEPLFQALKAYDNSDNKLPIVIGQNQDNGSSIIVDLTQEQHILIGGAALTGKSTLMHTMIATLLFHKHPAELKLVLMDGKGLEFGCYEDLKNHYLAKRFDSSEAIITKYPEAIETINSIVVEIDNRLELLKTARTRNVDSYNKSFTERRLDPSRGHRYLPYIVLAIDEYSPFMSKEFERAIMDIGQKGATVGVHMILSTGQVERNTLSLPLRQQFPRRLALKTLSVAASRLLIGNGNSAKLSSKGNAIWSDSNGDGIEIFTPDFPYESVQYLVDFISKQQGYSGPYSLAEPFRSWTSLSTFDVWDPLIEEIARRVVLSESASTSSLQRVYSIGYNRAGKIMDQLEQLGIVGPAQGGRPRQVLVDKTQLEKILQNLR